MTPSPVRMRAYDSPEAKDRFGESPLRPFSQVAVGGCLFSSAAGLSVGGEHTAAVRSARDRRAPNGVAVEEELGHAAARQPCSRSPPTRGDDPRQLGTAESPRKPFPGARVWPDRPS